jgi:hypothetical protein
MGASSSLPITNMSSPSTTAATAQEGAGLPPNRSTTTPMIMATQAQEQPPPVDGPPKVRKVETFEEKMWRKVRFLFTHTKPFLPLSL